MLACQCDFSAPAETDSMDCCDGWDRQVLQLPVDCLTKLNFLLCLQWIFEPGDLMYVCSCNERAHLAALDHQRLDKTFTFCYVCLIQCFSEVTHNVFRKHIQLALWIIKCDPADRVRINLKGGVCATSAGHGATQSLPRLIKGSRPGTCSCLGGLIAVYGCGHQ